MPTIAQMIDKIAELYPPEPPADATQLARAEQVFTSEFGIPMPEDYRELLSIANGVEFNGAMFYASEDSVAADGAPVFGLGESNQRLVHSENELDTPLRFVGETGDQLFGYDTADRTWKVVDRVGLDLDSADDVFATFTELFTRQVERFVTW